MTDKSDTHRNYAFLFSFPSCACKRSWNLKKKKVKQAPLSYRKRCSWNASSVVSPLILWLCDITLHHHVTHLHDKSLIAHLGCKYWFSAAALLLLGLLTQACVSWPIRRDLGIRVAWLLKETGAKTVLKLDSVRKLTCFQSIKTRKPVVEETKNKITS